MIRMGAVMVTGRFFFEDRFLIIFHASISKLGKIREISIEARTLEALP